MSDKSDQVDLYKDLSPVPGIKGKLRDASPKTKNYEKSSDASPQGRIYEKGYEISRRNARRSISVSRSRSRSPTNIIHLAGNYGKAGGNSDTNLPILDVMSKFSMTCRYWKTG